MLKYMKNKKMNVRKIVINWLFSLLYMILMANERFRERESELVKWFLEIIVREREVL